MFGQLGLSVPMVDSVVVPSLRAFLVSLTHLPVEVQIDLLEQATSQMSEVIEQSLQG